MIKCPILFMFGEYEVFVDLEDAMNGFKDCNAEKKGLHVSWEWVTWLGFRKISQHCI